MANAVFDATGVRMTRLPATPERILAAAPAITKKRPREALQQQEAQSRSRRQ